MAEVKPAVVIVNDRHLRLPAYRPCQTLNRDRIVAAAAFDGNSAVYRRALIEVISAEQNHQLSPKRHRRCWSAVVIVRYLLWHRRHRRSAMVSKQ